jgi:hypothetical protein
MEQYPTIYTDKSGRVKTVIHNVFSESDTNCLELIIDGIPFIGSSFDSFALVKAEKYNKDQLNRFTFNKIPLSGNSGFVWELCNCKLEFKIPQIITNTVSEKELKSELQIVIYLGQPASNGGINSLKAKFSLELEKKKFISESESFETGLNQLQKEMYPEFRFKNCFSCHYSDYSPAGSGFFSSLMCFRNNKAKYLTATQKEDFFKLALEGYIPVQETYCCDQFSLREIGTGYRGWSFDFVDTITE